MTDCFLLQGVATKFGEIIDYGDRLMYLKSDCLDKSIARGDDVRLLYDHDDESPVLRNCYVELYATKSELAFRVGLGEDSARLGFLYQIADVYEAYIPVSVGLTKTRSNVLEIDGHLVEVVEEATIDEISILSKDSPAVKSTFARVVTQESCDEMKADVDAGRFGLHGAYISLHRSMKAAESGDVVKYAHSPTEYDRAAARFERALQNLS
jgi:phage head maturation protease